MKISRLVLVSLLMVAHSASALQLPFSRGVNLTEWFQASNARQIPAGKYTRKDFENIRSLGADVIRLPINLHGMTSGAPDHRLDPLLFILLDPVVTWAEELGLHLILDNHSFDPAVNTSPQVWSILVPVWKQMAEHYRHRSQLIYYEVLNEPHGINDVTWNAIQGMVVDSIRAVDSVHTIIVGPAGWNSYNNLGLMPVYKDTNLIYTFHFYDPFIFTHQGASWASPSLVPLAGVPFPHDAARMPAVPSPLAGTWIQNDINNYASIGTVAKVQQTLDIAAAFARDRKVRLFCGEFGVFKPNSPDSDRVYWYETVRKYLEQQNIAWTIWDYQGGFGLFRNGTDEMFDHHLNTSLVTALGFTLPPQSPYVLRPDSLPVDLYRDVVGPGIRAEPYSGGEFDLFSGAPFAGNFSLRWSGAAQYQSLVFNFHPNKDLSLLKQRNYRLSFRVKGSSPGVMFDVRFVDTKTGPSDHPWRMRATVTGLNTPWNGEWQTFSLPLGAMTEHGAWDSIWYNPQGLFDWRAVDRFEITAEHASLAGKDLWFDELRIVEAPASVAGTAGVPSDYVLGQNFPNPFNPSTTIAYAIPASGTVRIEVFDVLGRSVAVPVNEVVPAGSHHIRFDASMLPSGTYYCRMRAGSFTAVRKMLVTK